MLRSYFNNGSNEELFPEVGNRYWVVVRRENFEAVFEATLKLMVVRDYLPESCDRTPSYNFDNGVILHGEGIHFYKELPEQARNLRALGEGADTAGMSK